MIKYIFKWRPITPTFTRNFSRAVQQSPVKLAYTVHDAETPKEGPQKTPVLFLHSFLSSKEELAPLSKALNQRTKRTVIAMDVRNHGESPEAPEMSFESMVADIKLFIQNLNLNKSILMGHSLGAGIMISTALKYPSLVEKIVVIEANPVESSPSLIKMGENVNNLSVVNFQGLRTLDEARKHADISLRHLILSPVVRERFTGIIKEVSPGKFAWANNFPVIARDMKKNVIDFMTEQLIADLKKKPFTKPALFIGGSQSDFFEIRHYAEIREIFPRAEFAIIEGGNHWVHLKKPAEVLKIVSEFIN